MLSLFDFKKKISKLNLKLKAWSPLCSSQDLELQITKNLSISHVDKLQPGGLPLCHPQDPSTGHITSVPQDHIHLTSESFVVHRGLGIALGPHSSAVRGMPALWPWKRRVHGWLLDSSTGYFRMWIPSTLYPSPSYWVTGNLAFWGRQSISAGKDFRGIWSWGSWPRESMDGLWGSVNL